MSSITSYEAFAGLHYKDAERKLDELRKLIAFNAVLAFGKAEAERAGKTRGTLRKQGITVGHLDIMIAATALEHDLMVVTNNIRHFKHIPELKYGNWTEG